MAPQTLSYLEAKGQTFSAGPLGVEKGKGMTTKLFGSEQSKQLGIGSLGGFQGKGKKLQEQILGVKKIEVHRLLLHRIFTFSQRTTFEAKGVNNLLQIKQCLGAKENIKTYTEKSLPFKYVPHLTCLSSSSWLSTLSFLVNFLEFLYSYISKYEYMYSCLPLFYFNQQIALCILFGDLYFFF